MSSINEYRQMMQDAAHERQRAERNIRMLEAAGEDTTEARRVFDDATARMMAANARMFELMEEDPEAAAVDAQTQAEERGRREVSDPFGQARGWGS